MDIFGTFWGFENNFSIDQFFSVEFREVGGFNERD